MRTEICVQRVDRWLTRPPAPEAEAMVLCLPFSGTGASLFRRWPQSIGPVSLCPVQLPGREYRIRQSAYRTVEEFAAGAAPALLPLLDRPYAVFGHCMGALLAHALVARLEELGAPPANRLIVSSAVVPHVPADQRYRLPAEGATGVYHPSMSDDELAAELQNVSSALGDGPVLPELVPLAVRVLRGDVEMLYRYQLDRPRPVSCPITAIGWTDDPDVKPARMTQWSAYGEATQRVLDGDKLSFILAPPALLGILAEEFGAIDHTMG